MPPKNVYLEDPKIAQYKAGYRAFLLLSLFLIGVAIYEYDFWTKWEAKVAAQQAGQGPWILIEDSYFTPLYDRAGKWGVVAVNAALAVLSLGASAFLFWQLRSVTRRRRRVSESPSE